MIPTIRGKDVIRNLSIPHLLNHVMWSIFLALPCKNLYATEVKAVSNDSISYPLDQLETIGIGELLKNPQSFHGKQVRLLAVVYLHFEGSSLCQLTQTNESRNSWERGCIKLGSYIGSQVYDRNHLQENIQHKCVELIGKVAVQARENETVSFYYDHISLTNILSWHPASESLNEKCWVD